MIDCKFQKILLTIENFPLSSNAYFFKMQYMFDSKKIHTYLCNKVYYVIIYHFKFPLSPRHKIMVRWQLAVAKREKILKPNLSILSTLLSIHNNTNKISLHFTVGFLPELHQRKLPFTRLLNLFLEPNVVA